MKKDPKKRLYSEEEMLEYLKEEKEAYKQKLKDNIKQYSGLDIKVVFDEHSDLELHVSNKNFIDAELKEFKKRANSVVQDATTEMLDMIDMVRQESHAVGMLDEYNPYFVRVYWISKEISDILGKLETEKYNSRYRPKVKK